MEDNSSRPLWSLSELSKDALVLNQVLRTLESEAESSREEKIESNQNKIMLLVQALVGFNEKLSTFTAALENYEKSKSFPASMFTKKPDLLSKGAVQTFWTVEPPSVNFHGRIKSLQAIHEKFQLVSQEKDDDLMRRLVVLAGPHGIGKSELARKFVHDLKSSFTNAAWIEAGSPKSIRMSFINLAKTLKLQFKEEEQGNSIAKRVFSSAGNLNSSVFIYNDAKMLKGARSDVSISEYLPPSGDILILTGLAGRAGEWKAAGAKLIHVTELSYLDSVEYFRSRFQLSSKALNGDEKLNSLIEKLSRRLTGYPLELQMAAANINYSCKTDPSSKLQQKLMDLLGKLHDLTRPPTEEACIGVDGGSFRIVWEMIMERVGTEMDGWTVRVTSTSDPVIFRLAKCFCPLP